MGYYIIKVGNKYYGTSQDGSRYALVDLPKNAEQYSSIESANADVNYLNDIGKYKGKKRQILKVTLNLEVI